jgi:hypothetical protein
MIFQNSKIDPAALAQADHAHHYITTMSIIVGTGGFQ